MAVCKEKKTNARNSPVAWFVMLERARASNNFAFAAQALQELTRLGVTVKYSRAIQQGGRRWRMTRPT